MAAVEWIITMKTGLKLLEKNPHSTKLIRYEELLNTPDKLISDIFSFCELEDSTIVREYMHHNLKLPHKRENFKLSPCLTEVFANTLTKMGYLE